MTEHYTQAELREAVSILLNYIDKTLPKGFHYKGQTADWFVAAASMSCNIPSNGKPTIEYLRELNDVVTIEDDPIFTIEVL